MMNVYENIIDAIGKTPLVRLNKLGKDTGAAIYVKLEFLNPGSSIKDRIAVQMIEDAEKSGQLVPGGTVVECTSGNTGMGLALVGAARGYHTILVMPDKVSDEKIKALRAFGAKVICTPTAVTPEDPRSYYQVARRIAETTPNAFFANQYENMSNPEAHFRTTGPEIWDQIGDRLDAIVVATGTGGTISGIARFIKPRKPSVKYVLVDPVGSIYYEYIKTGNAPKILKTYKVEGFGEDFIPGTMDLSVVDDVVQVSDKECFTTARELTRKEGIFGGGSCGGAVAGAIKFARAHPEAKTIVVVLPDSGSRYLTKVFDDAWLRQNGFLEEDLAGRAEDLLARRKQKVIAAQAADSVKAVLDVMKKHGISQVPVLEGEKLVGMLSESGLLGALLSDPSTAHKSAGALAEPTYDVVEPTAPVSHLSDVVAQGKVALVMEAGRLLGVVTKFDLIEYLAAANR
ncbi:MAG TPA: cysteine synthase A [Candidatus Polarisedimenticolia bacterium]|nr:cysteine synthase A [Candidatus Polarisedimenticolia bacterium]